MSAAKSLLSTALWLALTAGALLAQGTRADFDRAAQYDARTRDLVFRAEVAPQFLDGGARFWYRVKTGRETHEWVLVDPDVARRELLFDHDALAAALSAATGAAAPISPNALPLTRVDVEPALDRVRFRANDRTWSWDRATGSLESIEAAAPSIAPGAVSLAPKRSRGGDEVSISIVNDHSTAIELYWLDFDGARRSYGKIAPGARVGQRTFRGHVFVAVNEQGIDVAAIVIPRDAEDGDEARIPATVLAEPAPSRDSGSRGGAPTPDRTERRSRDSSASDRFELAVDGVDLALTEKATGTTTRFVARDHGAERFDGPIHWHEDGVHCAIYLRDRAEDRKVTIVESAPRDQVQPKTHVFDYAKPGDELGSPRICIVDAQAKAIRLVEPAHLQQSTWSITQVSTPKASPASDPDPAPPRFRFLVNERGHQRLTYVEVDATTGRARAIVDERSPTFLDYAFKTFLQPIGADDDDLLWMSERSGWNHLYRIDAKAGRVRNAVTSGEFVVKRVVEIDAANGWVYLVAVGVRPGEDPYHEHLCRASLDGSKFERLTEGDGTHSFSFTPDKRYFLDTWSRVDHPPVTELRRVADGALVLELERADWSALLATGFRPAERFVAKGRDGATDIHGIIVRPDGYDPKQRYPVVEHIYAGPHDQHVPKAFSRLVLEHEIAELGFIVVRIDGMGTNWRSKAFHDVCWRNLKDAGLLDRIAWIRAAANHDPAFDLSRVGIFGGSAGGQNALAALLHHGDFYRVAVADCGCHDNRMDKVWWNEAWMGWPIGDWYADNSNVTHAGKLEGKLLLIVGELDRNVDPASTMQVVDALVRADEEFDLLVLPGVGHGAAETPYGRRRRADFLVRHLLGVEPRAR